MLNHQTTLQIIGEPKAVAASHNQLGVFFFPHCAIEADVREGKAANENVEPGLELCALGVTVPSRYHRVTWPIETLTTRRRRCLCFRLSQFYLEEALLGQLLPRQQEM